MGGIDRLAARVQALARKLARVEQAVFVILATDEGGSESAAFVGWAERPCLSGAEAAAWWEAQR